MEINMNNNLKNEQEIVQNQIINQNQQEKIKKKNDELFSFIEEYLSKQLREIKKSNTLENVVLEEILEQVKKERIIYNEVNKKNLNVLKLENEMLEKIKARIENLYKIYLIDEEKDVVSNKEFSVKEDEENDEDFRRIVVNYELNKNLYGVEFKYIEELYENLRDLISFYESNQKENIIEEKTLNKTETPTSSNEIFKFNSLMSEEKIYNLKNENEGLFKEIEGLFQKIKDILDRQDNKIGNDSELVKILENLKSERENYKNNADGSFIVLENYKLQELLEAFYEILNKYGEGNIPANEISEVYNKLNDLKGLLEFYETTSKNFELIKLKNENEKYYFKIFNFLFKQCKNMEKKTSLMKLLEEINLFKEIWSKKNISKNYNVLSKENKNLKDVDKSLSNLLGKIGGDKKFCEIINKYKEDKHFNYLLNYGEIRELYSKLINLKDFYVFSSEEKLENLNTITLNEERKTNEINIDKKERKMQSVKVFKQRYIKEAIYEGCPKILAEIEEKLGDVQQNADNIKYTAPIKLLKSMLEKLKTYYDEIDSIKTINKRNKFDSLFLDLFQKFQEILFKLKYKPEQIEKFTFDEIMKLNENKNKDKDGIDDGYYDKKDDSDDDYIEYERCLRLSPESQDVEDEKKALLYEYAKIKEVLPEESGLPEKVKHLMDNIERSDGSPLEYCEYEIEYLDKELEKISIDMLKLNMKLNKFKSYLDSSNTLN